MNKTLRRLTYIISDYLAAVAAWVLFFFFRKLTIENNSFDDINLVFADVNLYKGIVFIPLFWLCLYWCAGEYRNVYKKSRLKDFLQTVIESFAGVIVLFFAFLLDDYISTYKNYYFTFALLLVLHFFITYIPRLILTWSTVIRVHNGKIGFPTLMIVSDGQKAESLYRSITNQEVSSGYKFTGYITPEGNNYTMLDNHMPLLGSFSDLQQIIEQKQIEEIIVVLDRKDENEIYNIIFSVQNPDIEMFMPSDRKDLLTGSIKLKAIFSVPLVRISQQMMSPWEFSLKRIFDVVVSLVSMTLLIPVYIAVAVIIKSTSKGPVFYAQQRIGKNGKPFMMYKFRSMYTDAEKDGPMLSNGDDDPRITPFGRFMRKVRLDETPQFFHVLRGEMSMVGPRPERQYFIDKIVQKAPEYKLLQKIKPGMTSWGQVKFGYADTVDQMVERLQYDLLYLENMSVATDIKILLYTFIIIFEGRGK
ncbi:MAG: sugar transferase [Bacteroidales bacterium]|nr:sugar transferase [Bacteroidales bacterium]